MNIREPRQFDKVRADRKALDRRRHQRKLFRTGIVVALVIVLVFSGLYARPLPSVSAKTLPLTVATTPVALAWPTAGQASIGTQSQGVLASTNNQQPVPTASVAKVMLALAVLKKYPLALGQQGPRVPITAADVDLYNKYFAIDGSTVAVAEGEQITEYQAIQAALLPSANNMADTLAVWAYGSMAAYYSAANGIAQSLGMTRSTFAGDASGFLPETVSTASDIVLMGQAALNNPVIAEIVAQETAELPVAGTVRNVNFLLGEEGNVGIKTGNSDQAGGCYLFAVKRIVEGRTITAIGAILASPTRGQAILGSRPLANSFFKGFGQVTVLPKNTVVGNYQLPWGGQIAAKTVQDATVFNWRGSKTAVRAKLLLLKAPKAADSPAGVVELKTPYDSKTVAVTTAQPINAPTWQWRIFNRQ